MHPDHPPRFYERSKLRWINGIGFAVTVLVAVWVLVALFGLATGAGDKTVTPPPLPYLAVAALSLVALLVSFAYVLNCFWRGEDMGRRGPRTLLYIWSLIGTLCFAVLGMILWRFSSPGIPAVPAWAMKLLWFLTVPGLITFGALCYVNADLPSEDDLYDDEDAYEDDAYYEEGTS